MEFRIADTFTDSLARLTGDEQKLAKMTAFDLQLNLAGPGLQFHKLDQARDKNFWSVRVGSDIRLIVHRSDGGLLLCYVDHHDKAYAWAERRKLQTHPKTGAAQLVEIRETVQEIRVPKYVDSTPATPGAKPLFAKVSEDELLGFGVPPEWLADVQKADEHSLLTLAERLPSEAAEALLELATGGKPRAPVLNRTLASPFQHPDAQRRFRVMNSVEELERALEYPWDKWTVFLHPEQRQTVERDYGGPVRVSGSAGTGKTIVALHRAVYLARQNPDARVLLTTFSDPLASALRAKLMRLISNEPRLAERLEVHSLDAVGMRLYKSHVGPVNLAPPEVVRELMRGALQQCINPKFTLSFLRSEWEQVVDAWQLDSWESYRDVVRLGRKIKLPEPQRIALWSIFALVQSGLAARNLITRPALFTKLALAIRTSRNPPFEFVVVDEAQDIAVAQLRFLAAIGAHRPDALFFTGDLGQRIFQQPFSWLGLGVDIRGRAKTLRVNYRTSHQIRTQADRLLSPQVSDTDGNSEDRSHTISVFNGPAPDIRTLDSEAEECAAVATWIAEQASKGVAAHEFGVFVRSATELARAKAAVQKSGLPFKVLDEHVETTSGYVSIGTMHLAKGLEFRSVIVMACDDEVIPSQERIQNIGDESDLQEVYDTERHLLYVACTRARDHLLVTSVEPSSEFLADLES
jgi:mRNA-degrading endonuclease RelE of RelBE toxin-antitoxin system